MNDIEKNRMHGTTTVGIVCKEGLVLAADRRATAGNLIVAKSTEKVWDLTDNMVVTMAGTVSDAQLMLKLVKAELNLKRIRFGREPTVKEAANLLAGSVYYNIRRPSMIPGISHFLLGGKDEAGYEIYDVFPDGSLSKVQDFIASGSGSVFAYGTFESMYKKDMSLEDGVELVVRAINAALQRDTYSGNGITVVTISKDGVKRVVDKDVQYSLTV